MSSRTEAALLPAGRSAQLHAAAGARLVCLSGRMLVRGAPQWMAEQVLAPQQVLREGETLTVVTDGWLRVEAERPARYILLAPPPGVLARALAALAGAVKSLRPGKRKAGAGHTA